MAEVRVVAWRTVNARINEPVTSRFLYAVFLDGQADKVREFGSARWNSTPQGAFVNGHELGLVRRFTVGRRRRGRS